MKRIIVIAGPNGAGKTTFAREFLPLEANCPDFINADLIASGLSPFDPQKAAIKAGRLMLAELKERITRGKSFAFETTLSGRIYLKTFQQCRESGYHILLVFLSLPSPDMAVARVAGRVAQGGHDVPEEDVRRRFYSGLKNFYGPYRKVIDAWALYDNSDAAPVLLERGENK